MPLGKNVKNLREQNNWTLKELSQRSGVPVGTIGAIEVRDSVRSEYASKLAQAFGISTDELISGTPPAPALLSPSNHAPARVDGAGAATESVAELVAKLAESLSQSPSRGSDALIGTLSSLAKDPTNSIYQETLEKLLSPPNNAVGTTTNLEPPGFLKR